MFHKFWRKRCNTKTDLVSLLKISPEGAASVAILKKGYYIIIMRHVCLQRYCYPLGCDRWEMDIIPSVKEIYCLRGFFMEEKSEIENNFWTQRVEVKVSMCSLSKGFVEIYWQWLSIYLTFGPNCSKMNIQLFNCLNLILDVFIALCFSIACRNAVKIELSWSEIYFWITLIIKFTFSIFGQMQCLSVS